MEGMNCLDAGSNFEEHESSSTHSWFRKRSLTAGDASWDESSHHRQMESGGCQYYKFFDGDLERLTSVLANFDISMNEHTSDYVRLGFDLDNKEDHHSFNPTNLGISLQKIVKDVVLKSSGVFLPECYNKYIDKSLFSDPMTLLAMNSGNPKRSMHIVFPFVYVLKEDLGFAFDKIIDKINIEQRALFDRNATLRGFRMPLQDKLTLDGTKCGRPFQPLFVLQHAADDREALEAIFKRRDFFVALASLRIPKIFGKQYRTIFKRHQMVSTLHLREPDILSIKEEFLPQKIFAIHEQSNTRAVCEDRIVEYLNKFFAFVVNENKYIFFKHQTLYVNGVPMKMKKFRYFTSGAVRDGMLSYHLEFESGEGKKPLEKSVYQIYNNHPGRRVFTDVVFSPKGPVGENHLNLFRGFGFDSNECEQFCDFALDGFDLNNVLQHIHDIWCGSNLVIFSYVMKWFAAPLQSPGRKLRTMLLIQGLQGTGKGIVLELLRGIYGEYSLFCTNLDDVLGKFNSSIFGKILCIFDEFKLRKQNRDASHFERLKDFVTEDTLNLRRLYSETEEQNQFCNFVAISNNDNVGLFNEGRDRRIVYISLERKIQDSRFFKRFANWVHDPRGLKSFYWYLTTQVDLSGWNETDKPITDYEQRISVLSVPTIGRFLFSFTEIYDDAEFCMLCGTGWPNGEYKIKYTDFYNWFCRWCHMEGEGRTDRKCYFESVVRQVTGLNCEEINGLKYCVLPKFEEFRKLLLAHFPALQERNQNSFPHVFAQQEFPTKRTETTEHNSQPMRKIMRSESMQRLSQSPCMDNSSDDSDSQELGTRVRMGSSSDDDVDDQILQSFAYNRTGNVPEPDSPSQESDTQEAEPIVWNCTNFVEVEADEDD